MDRQITFIDTDENPLVVQLKDDRIQLAVFDSRPELEGNELRGFATALFAAYVGGGLAGRLGTASGKLDGVRDQLAAAGGFRELVAALDGATAAIAAVRDALTAATIAVLPEPSISPDPLPRTRGAIRRAPRGPRLGEGGLLEDAPRS
jgi:hypothetical protein